MKIAIDARPLQSSSRMRGIGTYVRGLIQSVLDQGHEIVLIVWGKDNHELAIARQQLYPMPLPKLGILGWYEDREHNNHSYLELADQVDLIHFTSPFEMSLSWPRIDVGIPLVVTVHNLMPVTCPNLCFSGFKKMVGSLYKTRLEWLKSVNGIISVSQHTTQQLQQNIAELPLLRTIPLGVGRGIKRPGDDAVAKLREKLKLPDKFILYFGSLVANKNVDALLQAAKGSDLPPIVVAGAASERDTKNLYTKYKASGVRFLGRIPAPDVPALYAAAELLVQPAVETGFGLSVIEAMACGLPTACSDIPTLHETASDATVYFDPKESSDILKVVSETLANRQLMEQLRQKGLERAKQLTLANTSLATWEAYTDFIDAYNKK